MPKGKKNKVEADEKKLLLKKPTILLEHDNILFTDRIR